MHRFALIISLLVFCSIMTAGDDQIAFCDGDETHWALLDIDVGFGFGCCKIPTPEALLTTKMVENGAYEFK